MPQDSTAADMNDTVRWSVLVFPGGTEIGLELRQALGWSKEIELFSAGSAVSNHAPFVFAKHFVVPSVHEPNWVSELDRVCFENGVTHIFPAHDDVIAALADNLDRLNAKVVSSPPITCRVARSKALTYQRLDGIVPVPRWFRSPEQVAEFPVFVKPDRGQGSFNAVCARDEGHLRQLLTEDPTRLILEYLPGPEFTIDCFSDRDRGLLYAEGRQRARIRNGIAMHSSVVRDPRFEIYARRIADKLPLHGGWFYQVKTDKYGELKLLELAPRIGGTSGLSRARGVNLPLLSLYECEREPVSITVGLEEVEIDRALVSRFSRRISYQTIYVDLDDTLILRGKVNTELTKLLYQAVNRGTKIVLVSRHASDLAATLRRHRLTGLFDEIVHIRDGKPKADYVTEKNAIFIDDSFSEREAVARATGIPVFAPSMIETLFDERV